MTRRSEILGECGVARKPAVISWIVLYSITLFDVLVFIELGRASMDVNLLLTDRRVATLRWEAGECTATLLDDTCLLMVFVFFKPLVVAPSLRTELKGFAIAAEKLRRGIRSTTN